MVALWIKIIVVAFILMFIDLLISPWLPEGGIMLGGEKFTLITLLIRLFELLAAFLVLILHAITHILQPVFLDDVMLLIEGIISVFLWLIGSFLDLILHLLALPFLIVNLLFPTLGWGIKLDIGDITNDWINFRIGLGGLLIDFRTLTFQVQIGELNPLTILGVDIYVSNTIGFSLLGNTNYPQLQLITGQNVNWYRSDVGAFGIIIDFKDGIYTCFPDVVKLVADLLQCVADGVASVGICWAGIVPFPCFTKDPLACFNPANWEASCNVISLILETPADWKDVSLYDEFVKVIVKLGFPTPPVWIDKVYDQVIPTIASSGISTNSLTDIQNFIKVRKWHSTEIMG